LHSSAGASPRLEPRLAAQAIRSLAEAPEVYTRLQAEAEAAHRELAFEEADISVRKNARGFSIEVEGLSADLLTTSWVIS